MNAPVTTLSHPNLRVKILAEKVLYALPFMAKQDIRYYLNGINIAPRKAGGCYVVATNGHAMAVVICEDAVAHGLPDGGVTMRVSPGLAAALRKPIARIPVHLCIEGDRVACATDLGIQGSDLESFIQAGRPWIDGKFPDFRRVLPNFAQLKRQCLDTFNGNYLLAFTNLKVSDKRRCPAIALW